MVNKLWRFMSLVMISIAVYRITNGNIILTILLVSGIVGLNMGIKYEDN